MYNVSHICYNFTLFPHLSRFYIFLLRLLFIYYSMFSFSWLKIVTVNSKRFRVLLCKLQCLYFLGVGICWLFFPLGICHIYLGLGLHMSSNFGLGLWHFNILLWKLSILLYSSRVFFSPFRRELTWLSPKCKLNLSWWWLCMWVQQSASLGKSLYTVLDIPLSGSLFLEFPPLLSSGPSSPSLLPLNHLAVEVKVSYWSFNFSCLHHHCP